MEFFEVIQKRRSCRRFTSKPVPKEVVTKAIDAALMAPNSSNMQPWEFYWVQTSHNKAELAKACLSQPAATTAQEFVVAVSRIDTWKRNQKLQFEHYAKMENVPKKTMHYYKTVVPFAYDQGFLSLFGRAKGFLAYLVGFFRPTMRSPFSKSQLFEVVTKTTALACENLMLAVYAQGFACCPMEGFDEKRVKKLLGLRGACHIVMVISIGEADPKGIFGNQLRFDKDLFVKIA